MVDETDRKILRALQKQGRLSMQELAAHTGIASATCWRRLRILEKEEIIQSYKAVLNREALDFSVTAFVHIMVERQNEEIVADMQRKIRARPEVMECYATTGDADFTLRVVSKDISDYDRFLQQFLFKLPGIGQVRSSIALREIKYTTDLPI